MPDWFEVIEWEAPLGDGGGGTLGDSSVVGAGFDDAGCWGLARRLAAGEVGCCGEMLRTLGSPAPVIVWQPEVAGLEAAELRFLLGWWQGKRAADGTVPARSVDPFELRPALGYISLLDVIEAGEDFRYRLYGSGTVQSSHNDFTGKMVSEIATPLRDFFLVTYRAVLARNETLFTWHTPKASIRLCGWHRLVLPLHDEAGQVARLLAAILPARRQPSGGYD